MSTGSGFTPKNWRRRWFVLQKGTLTYYKDPKDLTEALGVIPLPGYLVSPADPGKRLFNKFGFKVDELIFSMKYQYISNK
jgi:hypothetical protein